MHECHEEERVPRSLNPTQTQKAQELLWGSSAQWACCGVKPAAGPTLPRGGPADTVPGVGVGLPERTHKVQEAKINQSFRTQGVNSGVVVPHAGFGTA